MTSGVYRSWNDQKGCGCLFWAKIAPHRTRARTGLLQAASRGSQERLRFEGKSQDDKCHPPLVTQLLSLSFFSAASNVEVRLIMLGGILRRTISQLAIALFLSSMAV